MRLQAACANHTPLASITIVQPFCLVSASADWQSFHGSGDGGRGSIGGSFLLKRRRIYRKESKSPKSIDIEAGGPHKSSTPDHTKDREVILY